MNCQALITNFILDFTNNLRREFNIHFNAERRVVAGEQILHPTWAKGKGL